jgi:WSC domain
MYILGYSYTDATESDSLTNNLTVSNNGMAIDPNSFFECTDLPPVRTEIAARQSITVGVIFAPTTIGEFHTNLQVWTNGGVEHILFSGAGSTAPVAKLEVFTAEGGWVTIPDCAGLSECSYHIDVGTIDLAVSNTSELMSKIRFSNAGGSPLSITKSKPPLGHIAAANPTTDLSEGLNIQPSGFSTGQILFVPGTSQLNSPPKAFSGVWTLNTNDPSFGVHVMTFTGTIKSRQTGPLLSSDRAQFQYLGCYQDTVGGRIEDKSFTNDKGMTNGACLSTGLANNATFAGTEYSKECWYGNTVPPSHLKSPDVKCTGYICVGDSLEFCGGPGGYMPMYYDTTKYNPNPGNVSEPVVEVPDSLTLQTPSSLGGYYYAGCWRDQITMRGRRKSTSSLQSLEQCGAICEGYRNFGTT